MTNDEFSNVQLKIRHHYYHLFLMPATVVESRVRHQLFRSLEISYQVNISERESYYHNILHKIKCITKSFWIFSLLTVIHITVLQKKKCEPEVMNNRMSYKCPLPCAKQRIIQWFCSVLCNRMLTFQCLLLDLFLVVCLKGSVSSCLWISWSLRLCLFGHCRNLQIMICFS